MLQGWAFSFHRTWFSFDTLQLAAGRFIFLVEKVTLGSLVTNDPFWELNQVTALNSLGNQLYFMRRSTVHVQGDRKTREERNCHDLRALTPLCLSNSNSLFLTGAKEPSMNVSFKLMPFRSRKSSAKVRRISSKILLSTMLGTSGGGFGTVDTDLAGLSKVLRYGESKKYHRIPRCQADCSPLQHEKFFPRRVNTAKFHGIWKSERKALTWIIHEIRFVFERGSEGEAVYPHTASLIVCLERFPSGNAKTGNCLRSKQLSKQSAVHAFVKTNAP